MERVGIVNNMDRLRDKLRLELNLFEEGLQSKEETRERLEEYIKSKTIEIVEKIGGEMTYED